MSRLIRLVRIYNLVMLWGDRTLATGARPSSETMWRLLAWAKTHMKVDKIAYAELVHGSGVATIKRSICNVCDVLRLSQTDALLTKERGLALFIRGKDCPPIFIVDFRHGVIAAIHGSLQCLTGWKDKKAGRLPAQGILTNVMNDFTKLGGRVKDAVAFIGPGCGGVAPMAGDQPHPPCYEFDEEDLGWIQASVNFPIDRFIKRRAKSKPVLDITGLFRHMIHAVGITQVMELYNFCTLHNEEFISLRRGEPNSNGDGNLFAIALLPLSQ